MRNSIVISSILAALLLGVVSAFFPVVSLSVSAGVGIGMLLVMTGKKSTAITSLPLAPALVGFGLLALALGQFGRIPPLTGEILIIDVIAAATTLTLLLQYLASRKNLHQERGYILIVGIVLAIITGLITTGVAVSVRELVIGGSYALRFLSYILLAFFLSQSLTAAHGHTLITLVRGTGIVITLIGFVQLAVLPNLAILSRFGWDPHIGRLVSTFLDPNYLAGFLAIILAIIFGQAKATGKPVAWIWVGLIILATILTFSRSGYLVVFITLGIAAAYYSWRVLIIGILVAVPIALTIPRVSERVVGAFSIDTTSQMRIASWTQALTVANELPVTGTGYNLYRQGLIGAGIISESTQSHANSGSDSSLLSTYATMGIVGFGLLLGLISFSYSKLRTIIYSGSEIQQTASYALLLCLPALFVHSWFVNSFYYSLIVFPLSVLFAIAFSRQKL